MRCWYCGEGRVCESSSSSKSEELRSEQSVKLIIHSKGWQKIKNEKYESRLRRKFDMHNSGKKKNV